MTHSMNSQQPLFPISTVMQLTELSARQIRYYEANQLLLPARTEGKHRLYSLQDIERLLEVKQRLKFGYKLAAIQQHFSEQEQLQQKDVTDAEARKLFREEFKQNFLKKGKF